MTTPQDAGGPEPPARRRGVDLRILAPLRHRDYRLVASAALSSLLGDGFFLAAIALQVYAVRNVPTAMATVGMVWSGSALACLLVGGWASDRFERRRIMIAADLVRAAAIGGIGLLSVTGQLELWHVLVLGALFGASNAFFNPAATAIVPDLLPAAELPQANAFLGVARPAMHKLLGPALGGLVVGLAGPGVAFLVDAATFLVSAALLARVRHRPEPREPARGGLRTTLRDVGEGVGFVRANPWCWAWLVGAALSLLAFTGPLEVLLPFVLRNDMGLTQAQAAYQLGAVLAVGGLGSICVSVAVGQLDLPRRFVTAMYVAEAVGVGLIAVFGVMTSLWQALVASVVLNGLFAFTDIAWTTLLQRRVPRGLLGRVSSLDWLTSLGLMPLSFALAGTLGARFGAREVLVVGGLAGAAALLGLALVPGAREPERDVAAPPEPVAPGRASAVEVPAPVDPGVDSRLS